MSHPTHSEEDLFPTEPHPTDHPAAPAAKHRLPNAPHGRPIHLDDPVGRPVQAAGARPYDRLFTPLPPDRVASGYLELGQWLGDEYETEIQVALCLGPDGQVWAQVGPLEAVPLLPLADREQLVHEILAEFIDAYADWSPGERLHPTPQTLRSWPAWQLTAWLQETAPQAPPVLAKLMEGVLAEIEALGFRAAPVDQE